MFRKATKWLLSRIINKILDKYTYPDARFIDFYHQSPAEKITTSRRVQELLSDDILNSVLDYLETRYTKAWKETDGRDTQGREIAFNMVTATRQLRATLQDIINSGKYEEERHKLDKKLSI